MRPPGTGHIDIRTMKKDELIERLEELDLSTDGLKPALCARLIEANEGSNWLAPEPEPTLTDIRRMSEEELKAELERRNLNTTGNKRTLYRRLHTALQGNHFEA